MSATGNFKEKPTPPLADEKKEEPNPTSNQWGDKPSIEMMEDYEANLSMRDPFRVEGIPSDRQGIWHTKDQEPEMRSKYFIPGYEGDGGMHYRTRGEKNLDNQKSDRISRGANLVFSHRPVEYSIIEQKQLMEESLKAESIPGAQLKAAQAISQEYPDLAPEISSYLLDGENMDSAEFRDRTTLKKGRSVYSMPYSPFSSKQMHGASKSQGK